MAKIRTIKPSAFSSESMARVSVFARWTFAGLWTYLDDEGRGLANPRLIRAYVWPLDDDITANMVAGYLDELEREAMICRYTVDGRELIHATHWEHQHINRKTPSTLPECAKSAHGGTATHRHSHDTATALPEQCDDTAGREGKGRDMEGKGNARSTAIAVPTPPPVTARPAAPISGTRRIIEAWKNSLNKPPPEQLVGQLSTQIQRMLGEGIDPDDVARGLAAWQSKGNLGATLLPSVVNEVMNAQPSRPRHQQERDSVIEGFARRHGAA